MYTRHIVIESSYYSGQNGGPEGNKFVAYFVVQKVLCVLRSLRSQVSWIRKADLHVLTSGPHTFTGDLRFSSRHSQDPKLRAKGQDNWILQIKPTQLKDAGEYQCQVNTEPKISYSVFLKVRGKRVFAETHCVNSLFIVLGVISKFIL